MEAKKNELIVSMARDRKLLKDTQDQILLLMADSSGFILDNVKLIDTLETSKVTSTDIQRRLGESVQIEETINSTRELYTDVAERGAILYFTVADLAFIDPMY